MAASEAENGFADCELRDGGQLYRVQCSGPAQSSYRAELLGAILGLLRPGATHLALGNASVAHGLRDLAVGGLGPGGRRPWRKVADGDLWALAEAVVGAEGPGAVQ
eukprot:7343011-Alexandrium_andersonii.AAC.1